MPSLPRWLLGKDMGIVSTVLAIPLLPQAAECADPMPGTLLCRHSWGSPFPFYFQAADISTPFCSRRAILGIADIPSAPLPRSPDTCRSLLLSSMGKHRRVSALLPNRDHPSWPDRIQVGLQVDTGNFFMQPETHAQTTSAVWSSKRVHSGKGC